MLNHAVRPDVRYTSCVTSPLSVSAMESKNMPSEEAKSTEGATDVDVA